MAICGVPSDTYTPHKPLLYLAFFIANCLVAAASFADCLQHTRIQLLSDKDKHCRTLNILPTQLMDDKTLFLAAEAQRDSKMSPENRLLNSRWLMQSQENTYLGTAALRTVLRMSMRNAWKQKRATNPRNSGSSPKALLKHRHSALLNIRNYELKLSNNRMLFEFSSHF